MKIIFTGFLKEFFRNNYLIVIACVIALLVANLALVQTIDDYKQKYNKLHTKYADEVSEKFDLLDETESLSNEIVRLQETIIELEKEITEQPQWTSLGTFKITAYGIDCLGCTGITKSGTVPQTGRTIAVDPTIIPLGSKVMIDNQVYIAEDTGGAIQGKIIDLFYNTEQESAEYGVQYKEVYILKKE